MSRSQILVRATVGVWIWLACALPALAQLQNENIQLIFPDGFKIANETRKDGLLLSELIPRDQAPETWTQMITIRIIFGTPALTVDAFEEGTITLWKQVCPSASNLSLANERENGYAIRFWIESCPRNPQTDKPETVLMKAIAGNDSFYVVTWAFRTVPTTDEAGRATAFLRKIIVCDSRLPDRPCFAPKREP